MSINNVYEALQVVTGAGGARAALAETTFRLARGYELLHQLPAKDRAGGRQQLDGARAKIERYYEALAAFDATTWHDAQRQIAMAYGAVALIEDEAGAELLALDAARALRSAALRGEGGAPTGLAPGPEPEPGTAAARRQAAGGHLFWGALLLGGAFLLTKGRR